MSTTSRRLGVESLALSTARAHSIGRAKLFGFVAKALPAESVAALVGVLEADPQPRRRSDWMERDRALILTALLAGLRADRIVARQRR